MIYKSQSSEVFIIIIKLTLEQEGKTFFVYDSIIEFQGAIVKKT